MPERATEAYEAILAEIPTTRRRWPPSIGLNEAHGRVRGPAGDPREARRARHRQRARSIGAPARASCSRSKLNNPEAAASALRELGADAIADDEMLAALLRNLRRAGLAHEAARALSQRIEIERARAAGRRRASASPSSTSSCRCSSWTTSTIRRPRAGRSRRRWRRRPKTRRRWRRWRSCTSRRTTSPATPRRASARRGRCAGSPRRSRRCWTRAASTASRSARPTRRAPASRRRCEADPNNARGAAGAGGVAGRARRTGKRRGACWSASWRRPKTPDRARRGATPTWRARPGKDSADGAEAQRYLDEALALVPDHLPGDPGDRRHLLQGRPVGAGGEAPERGGAPPARPAAAGGEAVPAARRGAREAGQAGRSVPPARRGRPHGPRPAATKLSLGENRFRAGAGARRRCTSAGLADHPDAALYPDEVADALAHAAQAEIKLRHPERAIELYEAALKLRGGHRRTLRALADLALERGEKQKAAIYLRRIAEDVERPRRSARRCSSGWATCSSSSTTRRRRWRPTARRSRPTASPAEEQVPLLEKVLKLQRSTRATTRPRRRPRRCSIDLVKDPKERGERRREAAVMMAERGDVRGAAALLEQALAEDPQDEAALVALCESGRRAAARAFGLRRSCGARSAGAAAADREPASRAPRARLWQRLASWQREARSGRGHRGVRAGRRARPRAAGGARGAERAVRRAARLRGARRSRTTAGCCAMDITRADSLRALAAAYARRGLLDRARCCLEVLSLLGSPRKAEEIAFLDAHPSPDLQARRSRTRRSIDDQDRKRPPGAARGDADGARSSRASGRARPASSASAWKTSACRRATRSRRCRTWTSARSTARSRRRSATRRPRSTSSPTRRPTTTTCTIVVQAPPALVVGPRAGRRRAARRGPLPAGARHRAVTRPSTSWPPACGPSSSRTLFASVLSAFHPRHARRRAATGDAAAEQAAKLKKNVPYKVSKQLVELFQELGSTSWSSLRWRAVVHQIGNRTGPAPVRRSPDRGQSRARRRRRPRPSMTARRAGAAGQEPRAAARAAALRAQRRLLPAAREDRHGGRERRRGVATVARPARAVALARPARAVLSQGLRGRWLSQGLRGRSSRKVCPLPSPPPSTGEATARTLNGAATGPAVGGGQA